MLYDYALLHNACTLESVHCVSKKLPTFKLSVTLSNLNRFSKCLHRWKAGNLLQNPYDTIHLTLGVLLQYLWKEKFKFAADVEENGNKLHFNCLARDTVQLLQQETPEFIAPDLWPPNSPDLNPVDYRVWGLMQERVYKTAVRDTADLKQRLIENNGRAFHRLSSTKPLTSGGYDNEPASKQRVAT